MVTKVEQQNHEELKERIKAIENQYWIDQGFRKKGWVRFDHPEEVNSNPADEAVLDSHYDVKMDPGIYIEYFKPAKHNLTELKIIVEKPENSSNSIIRPLHYPDPSHREQFKFVVGEVIDTYRAMGRAELTLKFPNIGESSRIDLKRVLLFLESGKEHGMVINLGADVKARMELALSGTPEEQKQVQQINILISETKMQRQAAAQKIAGGENIEKRAEVEIESDHQVKKLKEVTKTFDDSQTKMQKSLDSKSTDSPSDKIDLIKATTQHIAALKDAFDKLSTSFSKHEFTDAQKKSMQDALKSKLPDKDIAKTENPDINKVIEEYNKHRAEAAKKLEEVTNVIKPSAENKAAPKVN